MINFFAVGQLYIENILTEQYSQYVHLLLDFGSLHYFLLNPLEYCHCLLLLLSQFKIDMALKIYQLIPLKCHFQYWKIHRNLCQATLLSSALKIMTSQWSLTIVKAFVTAKKPCQTVTMNTTTYIQPTTFINFNSFANSSKTIFAII